MIFTEFLFGKTVDPLGYWTAVASSRIFVALPFPTKDGGDTGWPTPRDSGCPQKSMVGSWKMIFFWGGEAGAGLFSVAVAVTFRQVCSVENYPKWKETNSGDLRYTHFPVNHDYGRKGSNDLVLHPSDGQTFNTVLWRFQHRLPPTMQLPLVDWKHQNAMLLLVPGKIRYKAASQRSRQLLGLKVMNHRKQKKHKGKNHELNKKTSGLKIEWDLISLHFWRWVLHGL